MAQTDTTTDKPTNGTSQPPPRFTNVRQFKKSFKKDPEERKNKVLAWKVKTDILERIKKIGIDEERALWVNCTHDMAMDLLTWNDMGKNRYIDENRIDQNKTDMIAGEFPVNGDSIKISKTFKLLDGQHRLWAIVGTGITLKILIVTGLEDKTMSYMDIGKNRSALDMVVINEYRTNPTALAYAIKNIIYIKKTSRVNSSLGSKDVPNFEVHKFLQRKQQVNNLIHWLELGKLANQKVPKWFSPAQWAFIYHLLYTLPFSDPEKGKKRVHKFITSFIEGSDLGKNDPVKILRDYFMNEFKDFTKYKKKNRIPGGQFTMKIKALVEAWNKFFKYEKVSELEIDMSSLEIQKPLFR